MVDEPGEGTTTGLLGVITTVLGPTVRSFLMVNLLSKPVTSMASDSWISTAPRSRSRMIASSSGGSTSGMRSDATIASSGPIGITELFPVSLIAPSCTVRKVLDSSVPRSTSILRPFRSVSVRFTITTEVG